MGFTEEIQESLGRRLRKYREKKNIDHLKNRDFSLICSNCNGGFILHDLKLKFRTPTINLWMEPEDYIEFLTHLQHYLHTDLVFLSDDEEKYGYPVGSLDNKVKVYFQHYESREIAEEKWRTRCERVNIDNLFILFTDRDGCTYENMQAFDRLPYPNKIIFTNRPYPEFPSAFYIRGFEDMESVGGCFRMRDNWSGRKYYDSFPFVKWFNGKMH